MKESISNRKKSLIENDLIFANMPILSLIVLRTFAFDDNIFDGMCFYFKRIGQTHTLNFLAQFTDKMRMG